MCKDQTGPGEKNNILGTGPDQIYNAYMKDTKSFDNDNIMIR